MKKSILILDDDVSIRTLLDLFLQKEYQIFTKKDGMEAMMWLEGGNLPDLIVSDVNMPRLNGYQFLNNIKKSGFFRSIPVIILSGIENDVEKARFIELGAVDYIVKPFSPTELLARIDAVVKPVNASTDAIIRHPTT
jgi:two-component system, chemotaxis family, chemotaxis protein CheY